VGSKVRVKKIGLEMDFFHVKLPEETICDKIITVRAAIFDLRGVKKNGLEMVLFPVKLPEKTIYTKIITAPAAVSDLGVKGQGQFFYLFFWLGVALFSCKIARESDLH